MIEQEFYSLRGMLLPRKSSKSMDRGMIILKKELVINVR